MRNELQLQDTTNDANSTMGNAKSFHGIQRSRKMLLRGWAFFWKTFHSGDCTVHRGEIESLAAGNKIKLKDGTIFETDFLILSTGFDKPFQVFSEELQRKLNLTPNPAELEKWAELENEAERTVDELLPALKASPFGAKQFQRERAAGGRKLLHGPNRHYRRLIVPALAAKGDRSIIFPGFTKGYKVSFARKDVVDAEVPFRLSAAPIFTPKAAS